jgi:ubiquinone/menaquinone biosynthesis C-methylase UbiE
MLEAVNASGFSPHAGDRMLDFGCGSGRMIRHLNRQSESCEIWGTDINANFVYWCKQYLEPPFHFVTTTTIPHLPFKDGYFDFVYAGSVFTHIDDLADAWLLELRRILSPDGRLYITIHDNHTMELLDTIYSHTWLSTVINSDAFYNTSRRNGGKIALGRNVDSQVFYDIDYFKNMLNSNFDVISVIPEAYDYQTAVLLKHRSKQLND